MYKEKKVKSNKVLTLCCLSVRLWISPGFVGLSLKPTPTVIGSLLKPLVTSAHSKYSKSFCFYTEGVDRPGFIHDLSPQSIFLPHTPHTLARHFPHHRLRQCCHQPPWWDWPARDSHQRQELCQNGKLSSCLPKFQVRSPTF